MNQNTEKSVKAHSHNGDETHPRETIFPIFRVDEQNCCHLVGTGFFIGDDGVFVTAKHIIEEIESKGGHVAIVHIKAGKWFLRNVAFSTLHHKADIAVVHLNRLYNQTKDEYLSNDKLKIAKSPTRKGDSLFTYAYPKTTIAYEELPRINIVPSIYDGVITEEYPDGRDRMLPSACYQVDMLIHGGASGGPVFNSNGEVVAINSSSMSFDEPDSGCTFVSCIQDVMDLDIYENAPQKSNFLPTKVSEYINDV
ncbi:S1 family peptidase [Shewanella mangrovi]|uniref:S1 family peptidase n=1 Tax=Shewanella mangrovi TaxID=1515746 RepID=UPI00138DE927|nr:serine protease [Shewanella mangrovi]